jgi:hypothetical protein
MRYPIERQQEIFERMNARCHVCRRRLARSSLGAWPSCWARCPR